MKTIIGADAAKLAGLQIDTLQKMRDGQITLAHLEWFNRLTKEERDQLFSGGKTTADDRFVLLNTFKLTVPEGYDHTTQLTSFYGENRKKFYYYNDVITDANFASASQKLTRGKTYGVKIWEIKRGEVVSSPDCVAFYKAQKAVLVGAQGISLAWEQKKDEFPKSKWTASFDEKDALCAHSGGYHGVPCVLRDSDGDWEFDLGDFEGVWRDGYCLLCFCDLSAEASAEADESA